MASVIQINKKGLLDNEKSLSPVFDFKVNYELLKRSVRIYLSNQRESNAHTKGRGEVSGSTRKIYKQKGTGNARRGSVRSPLMKGGGIVFGPLNTRNYKLAMSKSQRKISMLSAVALRASEKAMYVFSSTDSEMYNTTSKANEFFKSVSDLGKVLVIQSSFDTASLRAVSNVNNVKVKSLSEVSVYDIISCKLLCFDDSSLEKLTTRFEK